MELYPGLGHYGLPDSTQLHSDGGKEFYIGNPGLTESVISWASEVQYPIRLVVVILGTQLGPRGAGAFK